MTTPPEQKISFDVLYPQPLRVVISGPSGVGKDAVLHSLQKLRLPFHFVITATDRAPREDEVHGVNYFFVSTEEFERMIAEDELIEYAVVYDQYKGVPKDQVRQALSSGKDVIMRLDVQGATYVRQLCPEAILIFLVPACEQEWYQRLEERRSETPESLQLRVATAKQELERIPEFDYVVTNAQDKLEQAADQIVAIIEAEHLRVDPRKITL
ncbi:MAG: guanylate kinase, partial [Anaerolineaceae bacterium]|jgi:guanylate kinase|nr:guanylate kinase [Anaerolineaceae bacterium]